MAEKKKYYKFSIDFDSKTDKENFESYVHHIKTGKGIPIYQTVNEMLALHKAKTKQENKKKEK